MARWGAFADACVGANSARFGGGSTSCGLTAALFGALVCGGAHGGGGVAPARHFCGGLMPALWRGRAAQSLYLSRAHGL
jgi:hypothetical protein